MHHPVLAWMATVAARPLLRLAIGRWPDSGEVRQFALGFAARRRTLPPLLQGLAEVAPVRERLNELNFWQGEPFSFLHFEKTAGTSLVRTLEASFHPLQVHNDAARGTAPHVLSGFLAGQCDRARRASFVWGHYDLPALRRLDPARIVITVLREPQARLLSLYHFWRAVNPSALEGGVAGFNVVAAHEHDLAGFLGSRDKLIRNYIDNVYVRRLTGTYALPGEPDRLDTHPEQVVAEALRALDGLDFVGVVERFDQCLAPLGRAIGACLPATLPHHNAAGGDPGTAPAARKTARHPVSPEAQAELDRLTRLDSIIYQRALARLAAGTSDPAGGSSVTPCSAAVTQPVPSQTRPSITVLPSPATTMRL